MAEDPTKPSEPTIEEAAAARAAEAAADPEAAKPATPPLAAADKPPSQAPGEPIKGEVSRTDAPGAGVSAAAPAAAAPAAATEPGAPKPGPVAAPTSDPSPGTQPVSPAAPKVAEGSASAPSQASPAAPPAAKPGAPAGAKPGAPPAPRPAAPAAKPPAAAEHAPKAAPPTGPTEPAPPADLAPPAFIASLQAAIPGSVTHVSYWVGDWTIVVPTAQLLDVARHLRQAPDASFDFCSDVTATDWPPRAERFDLIYCLYSTRHRHRVRVKTRVADLQPIASVTPVWPSANWLEREVFDMFGVNFTDHPDRRRILMPDDWQGHPQRKDYPLEGPGELLMENPIDWLKLRQAKEESEIE